MDFRKLIVYLSLVLFAISAQAVERKKYNFNSDWLVTVGDVKNGESVSLDDSGWKRVTLPHAFKEGEAVQRQNFQSIHRI